MRSKRDILHKYFCFLTLLAVTTYATAQVRFDEYFEPKSLRFDFYLAGNAEHQNIYAECFREEPYWAGATTNLTNQPDYGEYKYRLTDEATGTLIFSRGFSSLFQEWRTTDEAKTVNRAYGQVIMMPYPKKPAKLEILARSYQTGLFETLFQIQIDPKSAYVNREQRASYPVTQIVNHGASAQKVDLVFVAEGYTVAEMDKFRKDVARFTEFLFKTKPFSDRQADFNVWAVECPSAESGVDVPGQGIWKNTALDAHFYTFGIDRYLTAPNLITIRDCVWNVPCDAVYVIVNSETYGGGGIYNYYGLSTADHSLSLPVFVHEFGHSFAGLADEYFESEVAYNDFYNIRNEPWEPNITTLVNFDSKWRDMLPVGTAIPTPDTKQNENRVGVYEGGGYSAENIYRPMINCRMRSNHSEFCPVCQRAIKKMIDCTIGK